MSPSVLTPTGERYAYGYGRIGVLQQQLLSPSDLDRLLGAHSEEELTRILGEIPFTAHATPLDDLTQFTPSMERWLRAEVEHMAPAGKADVFHILWLREDAPVIAYYLKKHRGYTSAQSNDPADAVTSVDIDALRTLIFEGQPPHKALPDALVRLVTDIKTSHGMTPQEIDIRVARYVAQRQLAIAKKSGSRLVRRYTAHLIDLQNIRTARRLGPENMSRSHFVEGGEIAIDMLTHDLDKLSLLIHRSTIPDTVALSIQDSEGSSVILERGLNRGLAHDIAEMRAVPLSIEPIFSFAIIALSHILLVRTILIGKAAKLSAEDIRTMLPPFFSTSFAAA